MFLVLYFINWPNFIAWLLLLLAILVNMCIAILQYILQLLVRFPGYDVKDFEINIIFLIKPFFYLIKKLRQTFKYLEKKRSTLS